MGAQGSTASKQVEFSQRQSFFTTRPLPVNVAVNASTEDVKAIVFSDNEDS